MIFVETPMFTVLVQELLSDEEYSEFQQFLIADPQVGDVIKGTGGKGKRGGVRVIYYVVDEAGQVRLLLIYKKGIQDDLTAAQRKQLKAIKDGWA